MLHIVAISGTVM